MKRSFKDRVDKRGLYANIAAKRRRIEAQKASGAKKVEPMRRPGAEGAPSGDDFKKSAKTAKGQKRQDPKGDPAGYYDKEGCKTCAGGKKPCKCSKKDMVGRKSSYADGYSKKCDAVAEELRGLLVNDDEEERADKPCGASFIAKNKKCSKQTTLRAPRQKSARGGKNYAGGDALFKIAKTASLYAAGATAARIAVNAIGNEVDKTRKRKMFLADLKAARTESNRKYGMAKKSYKRATLYNNSIQTPELKTRASTWAAQDLKEASLTNKMARTEMKLAIRRAKKSFPKSAARTRA